MSTSGNPTALPNFAQLFTADPTYKNFMGLNQQFNELTNAFGRGNSPFSLQDIQGAASAFQQAIQPYAKQFQEQSGQEVLAQRAAAQQQQQDQLRSQMQNALGPGAVIQGNVTAPVSPLNQSPTSLAAMGSTANTRTAFGNLANTPRGASSYGSVGTGGGFGGNQNVIPLEGRFGLVRLAGGGEVSEARRMLQNLQNPVQRFADGGDVSTGLKYATDKGGIGAAQYYANIRNFINTQGADLNAAEVRAEMNKYGVSDKDVRDALAGTQYSAGAVHALLNPDIGAKGSPGYGVGGLEGMSANINAVLDATRQQALAGTLTKPQVEEFIATHISPTGGFNEQDLMRATGKTSAQLLAEMQFKQPVDTKPLVCPEGYEPNAAGTACVKKVTVLPPTDPLPDLTEEFVASTAPEPQAPPPALTAGAEGLNPETAIVAKIPESERVTIPQLDTEFRASAPRTAIYDRFGRISGYNYSPAAKLTPATGTNVFNWTPPGITSRPRSLLNLGDVPGVTVDPVTGQMRLPLSASQQFARDRSTLDNQFRQLYARAAAGDKSLPAQAPTSAAAAFRNFVMSGEDPMLQNKLRFRDIEQQKYDPTKADPALRAQYGQSAFVSDLAAAFDPFLARNRAALTSLAEQQTPKSYSEMYPDIAEAYAKLKPEDKAKFPTLRDYELYHFDTYGRKEGRTSPLSGMGALQSPYATTFFSKGGDVQAPPSPDSLYKPTEEEQAAINAVRSGQYKQRQLDIYNKVQDKITDAYSTYQMEQYNKAYPKSQSVVSQDLPVSAPATVAAPLSDTDWYAAVGNQATTYRDPVSGAGVSAIIGKDKNVEKLRYFDPQGRGLRSSIFTAPELYQAANEFGIRLSDIGSLGQKLEAAGINYKPGQLYAGTGSNLGINLADVAAGKLGSAYDWTQDPFASQKGPGALERLSEYQALAQRLGINPTMSQNLATLSPQRGGSVMRQFVVTTPSITGSPTYSWYETEEQARQAANLSGGTVANLSGGLFGTSPPGYKSGGEISTEDFIKKQSGGDVSRETASPNTAEVPQVDTEGRLIDEREEIRSESQRMLNRLQSQPSKLPPGIRRTVAATREQGKESMIPAAAPARDLLSGILGASPTAPGSEAYRTGQAIANMPPVQAAAAIPAKIAASAGDAATALAAMGPAVGAVIKPKGGNWIRNQPGRFMRSFKNQPDGLDEDIAMTQERLAALENAPFNVETQRRELRQELAGYETEKSLNNWIDTKLGKYVKNEMGTPEDPLRKLAERGVLHIDPERDWDTYRLTYKRRDEGFPEEGVAQGELAKRWEDVADDEIEIEKQKYFVKNAEEMNFPSARRFIANNPWVKDLDPETSLYSMSARAGEDRLGFGHLIDELRNASNPQSGLPRELQIDPKKLDRISVPQAVELVDKINKWRVDNAGKLKLEETLKADLYKAYPEQDYRWVQLNRPGQFAAESDAMGHSVRGYEPPDKGGSDYYGLGGFKAIQSGEAKIYSLRDEKGQPHVTIEVEAAPGAMSPSEFYHSDLATQSLFDRLDKVDEATINRDKSSWWEEVVRESPEYQEYLKTIPPKVTQIKGKGNEAPAKKYLPFIQDFVKSGNWSEIDDLQNTGLIVVKREQNLPGSTIKINPGYYTLDELRQLAVDNNMSQDMLNEWMRRLNAQLRSGAYKDGGPVNVPRETSTSKQQLDKLAQVSQRKKA